MSSYGITKETGYSFEDAVQKTKESLTSQGFGVLTEIDVKQKMKEKIDKDMDQYLILGACHPRSAYEAIKAEQEIGLLLPCNVIVYEKNGVVSVSSIKPSVGMAMVENGALKTIALEIEQKLLKVIDAI